jgi:TctA family transporter
VSAIQRLKMFGPSTALMLFGFAGIAASQVAPIDGTPVAVIAPASQALSIVAAAGGKAITTSDTGIIAVSEEPGFTGRLYDSGAWLVVRFDGQLGCLNPNVEDL